ncbi:MAG TPA: hypothetical protein DCR48_02625 [Flavobacteriales bacterium]|nr:hypothetical protein [Flavobacteriales bacterium]
MYILRSTQLPNEIIDIHLPYLNQAQLKVLLVVIRQVLGWIDPKTKKRKRKDWISISFFHRKTGLTHKSISLAISELIRREIIVAMDYNERLLKTPEDRRGKKRIYYSYAPYFYSLKQKTCVDMLVDLFTYSPNTKRTHTKNNDVRKKVNTTNPPRPISDMERYRQIIQSQSNNSSSS